MIFYPYEKNSKKLPTFWHCIASPKWNLPWNKTTNIDAVDPSVHDVRTAGVSYRWYSVNVLVANFQKCCLVRVSVCVCKLWFEADAAEFAAVRMERHRTDEREREGESVKGKAAASSCPDSLWTPVLGVCVCAQSMTPSTRENAHSWLVIYSAQTTLGTEDRQIGCVLLDCTVMRWRRRRSPGQGRQGETRGSEAAFTMPFFRGNGALLCSSMRCSLTLLGEGVCSL